MIPFLFWFICSYDNDDTSSILFQVCLKILCFGRDLLHRKLEVSSNVFGVTSPFNFSKTSHTFKFFFLCKTHSLKLLFHNSVIRILQYLLYHLDIVNNLKYKTGCEKNTINTALIYHIFYFSFLGFRHIRHPNILHRGHDICQGIFHVHVETVHIHLGFHVTLESYPSHKQ